MHFDKHHYHMAEESTRGQLLDPISKEKDAISTAIETALS